MRKLGIALAAVLLLAGCSSTTLGTTDNSDTESQPEMVAGWLSGDQVSAQKILEDLTYIGFCDDWRDAPSPESAYGQAYARDFLRECSSYALPETTPDCSVGIQIDTEDAAIRIPTEMRFEDSSWVAIFAHPKFSIAFSTGGEYDPAIMVQRCFGAIKAMNQLLGGQAEVQLIDNKSIDSPLDQVLIVQDYWEKSEDYIEIGERVWMRWSDGLDTCPSGWYYCAGLKVVTAGWCQDLSLEYQLLDSDSNQVGETKFKSLSSESSYEPFDAVIGSKQSDPEFEYFSLPTATCNSWTN